MIGRTISHDQILKKLGDGGMGGVYRADEINLQRYHAVLLVSEQVRERGRCRTSFLGGLSKVPAHLREGRYLQWEQKKTWLGCAACTNAWTPEIWAS